MPTGVADEGPTGVMETVSVVVAAVEKRAGNVAVVVTAGKVMFCLRSRALPASCRCWTKGTALEVLREERMQTTAAAAGETKCIFSSYPGTVPSVGENAGLGRVASRVKEGTTPDDKRIRIVEEP